MRFSHIALVLCTAMCSVSGFRQLNGGNFVDVVENHDGFLVVAVVPPDEQCGEHCFKLREVLTDVSKNDWLDIAEIRVGESIPVGELEDMSVAVAFNVTEAPSLVLLPYGRKKIDPEVPPMRLDPQTTMGLAHAGAKTYARTLSQFLPSTVMAVHKGNMDAFATGQEDARAPRILVFSAKPDVHAVIRKVCLDLDRRAKCGHVHVPKSAKDKAWQRKLAARFGADKLPAVFIAPAPAAPLPGPGVDVEWRRYRGAPKAGAILEWALASGVAGAPLVRVRGQTGWDKGCAGKGGVCVLFAAGTREELAIASAVTQRTLLRTEMSGGGQASVVRAPLSFLRVAPKEQESALVALGAQPGRAGAVAVNLRKKRVAVYPGSFDEAGLAAWVREVALGKAETHEIDDFPRLATVAAPKKGKAGKARKKAPATGKDEL